MNFTENDFQALRGRLENWGKWMRAGNGGRDRCASAERLYVTPRVDEDGVNATVDYRSIDVLDADRIEQAVSKVQSEGYRQLVRSIYVFRWSDRQLTRIFKISVRDIGQHERCAVMHVWMALNYMQEAAELAALKKPVYNAYQQFVPSTPSVSAVSAA